MNRQALFNEIQILEEQKQRLLKEQKKQQELLNALREFKNRCTVQAQAFNSTLQRRRNKLHSLSGLTNTVKAAAHYSMRMGDMLNGTEYQKAAGNLEMLEQSVRSEIQKTEFTISEQERELYNLQSRIDQLRYQISQIPEENENEQQK